MQNPRQGYGEITIQLVSITNLDFEKSFVLKKFMSPFITDSPEAQRLYFRVSFYDKALDKITAPVVYSEASEILMSPGSSQVPLNEATASWAFEQLPTLHSGLNTLELVRESRLLMLVWAGGHS